ncbi:hypothetical protein G3M58_78730 [Streptomyces sp. SID7499]|uniref:Lipoprotein n=1 Tax=Streptomyces sp. SID7499 TaxID=2706086 RepID=A0A6G3XRQ7_9ACTN|nr:hypothetical protein [Streptomyces sp. SID7499]
MSAVWARVAGGTVVAAVLTMLSAGGCSGPSRPVLPRSEEARSELIKAAQQVLVDRCMTARGTTGKPASQEAALFGTDPAELEVTLATGYTVRTHTDGCLAQAHRRLYGDQARWFRAEVTVNNLRPEAQARIEDDPRYRAALARRAACPDKDTRCARESGLDDVRARLEPARLAEVRAAHRDDIATYDQLRDRALRQAARLLAGRPTPSRKGPAPS